MLVYDLFPCNSMLCHVLLHSHKFHLPFLFPSLFLSVFLLLCCNVMLMTGHVSSSSFHCLCCSVPSPLWWMWCCSRAPCQALRPCVWCHSQRGSSLLSCGWQLFSLAVWACACVWELFFIWGEGALRVSCLALTGSHLSVAVRAAAVSICTRICTPSMCSACWILERLHSHP